VTELKGTGVSERRACVLVGISRSSARYIPHPRNDSGLAERVRAIAERHKRYGYRRAVALLRREGETVNHKRVYRLWKMCGLGLPRRAPKKRRRGAGVVPCQAVRPNHVWTYDFMEDRCATGQKLKLLTVVDEFTRECLAITVARSIRAHDVIQVLDTLFSTRTPCEFIRSDNGPEFIARALNQWLSQNGTRTIYIDPGSPWQNAYGESFNGRFRDECLNMELFNTIAEAQIVIELWRREYNEQRPHSSLGYLSPTEFVTRYNTENVPNSRSTSLSLSGLPNGQEQHGQDTTPCPFVQPPTAALESLSSGALSSGWARNTIP